MSVFYDTHAHLDFPELAADLVQIMERAQAAGIKKVITIGTDLDGSERAIRLSEQYPHVYAAIGWHPSEAIKAPEDVRSALRKLASHPKVVAIGETGLDYHRLPSQNPGGSLADDVQIKQRQAGLFLQHLEIAAEFALNCVIHQRDAFEDVFSLMQPFLGRVRGVFHCFVDQSAVAKRVIDSGSIVSFTGIVTFKNGQNVRDTLATVPLDKLLLETDSPFLAPVPYRGKRCEPAYVKEIAEAVAQVKGCSLDELSAATCANAHHFFPKMDHES